MDKTSHFACKKIFLYTPIALALSACGGGGGDSSDDGGNVPPISPPVNNENRAPVAENISMGSDLVNPYLEVKLQGSDPDNDTLIYVLDSPMDGPGYKDAFIDTRTSTLHATLNGEGLTEITLPYKVSDGTLYSDRATVTIAIGEISESGLGANDIPPDEYGRLEQAFFDGDRFGSTLGDEVTLPRSIDLSGNFPTPGNQGRQGSCVGWTTAYALKSYHEKIEEQWDFSSSTVFSPAWIYNQINGGEDKGSTFTDAMQLMVDKGAATWQSMPYTDQNHLTQPSQAAISEAAAYKAVEYRSISSAQQMKAALANRNPVAIGVQVYENFERLQGPDSVYNTITGNNKGGHAITIVGYDDDRFGGAFKVINSWGTSWGDNGYFWLPYSMLSTVVSQAFVLTDGVNTGEIEPVVPVVPPSGEDLPNLQIANWDVSYDGVPGGAGQWQWEIVNAGTSLAPKGADVNLMLSSDNQIDSTDWYVVYEEIPEDLEPGASAQRTASNPRQFTFPQNLEAGNYYMAVWVDDLQEIEESDEKDNTSFGQNQISIGASSLPDIAIDYWWADWSSSGDGILEYTVYNNGTAPTTRTDWDINLVLSPNENPEDGGNFYLFYEHVNFILNPGEGVYRDESNPTYFNLYESQEGNAIPTGTYYMSLWVDDLSLEAEDNEINNLSVGNHQLSIEGGSISPFNAANTIDKKGVSSKSATSSKRLAKSDERNRVAVVGQTENQSFNFNGKRLPSARIMMKKVRISDEPDGTRRLAVIEDESPAETTQQFGILKGEKRHSKVIQAADKAIFPRVRKVELPETTEVPHEK